MKSSMPRGGTFWKSRGLNPNSRPKYSARRKGALLERVPVQFNVPVVECAGEFRPMMQEE